MRNVESSTNLLKKKNHKVQIKEDTKYRKQQKINNTEKENCQFYKLCR